MQSNNPGNPVTQDSQPRKCRTCGEPIPEARLRAIPSAVQCVPCLTSNGDEPKVAGHMIWDHKTAPYIEIGTRLAAERPDAHPRQGKNSQGLSVSRADRIYEGHPTNVRMARCHPNEPSVGPTGLCKECALEWYRERL